MSEQPAGATEPAEPTQRQEPRGPQEPAAPTRPPEPRRLRVRRSPRYSVFIVGGALVGAVVAAVLTYSEPASQYGYAATLGYLVVALGVLGALLGATAAVVAGSVLDRRSRSRG